MKQRIAMLSVLALTTAAFSEETLLEIPWAEVERTGTFPGERVPLPGAPFPGESLMIHNPLGKAMTLNILTIEKPPITTTTYAILGDVRYEDVEGTGYLEMWSYFPDDRYFSKTVQDRGLLQKIEGTSNWRPFVLPFFVITADTPPPDKLEVNVVLPGRGTIWLSPLRLVQYDPGEDPLMAAGQWWGNRTAGLYGGIAGAVIGCLGGLIGCLAGTGRARGFVLALMKALLAIGAACLIVGMVALARSQPYAVYYPFLLGGVLLTVLMAGLLPNVRKRYEQRELRKMEAMDTA
jgi:hypothetical protein